MSYFVDSHTHITNEELDTEVYKNDVKNAIDNDVLKAMMVFTNEEELACMDDLDHEHFDFAYGVYPSDKTEVDEEALVKMEEVIKTGKFKALGEIGLDYYWYPDNKETQKAMFARQIEIADKYNLPIIVHARDSLGDAYEVMKNTPCRRKGVLHCYSGSPELAVEFIKLGYYISFAGPVTFKNNRRGVETAKAIDLDHLLCETDAPYLAPVPVRGTRNESANVRYVYSFLSELLAIDIEDLKLKVKENYERLFG